MGIRKHRGASTRPGFELLEPRLLLSAADPSEALAADLLTTTEGGPAAIEADLAQQPAGTVELQWGGQTVTARAGQWIVRFSAEDVAVAGSILSAGPGGAEITSLGLSGFGLLHTSLSADEVADWALTRADIRFVQPDEVIGLEEAASAILPDDSYFPSMWGLNNTGQSGGTVDADIDAPEAWEVSTGSSDVVVAVIDTGFDYTHPDLVGNVWTNLGEIAGDGIDNDHNGYIDDVHGYDFYYEDGDPMDGHGHGTHVSGTIGATGDNGLGVVGINWDVQIMGLKFMSDSGSGYTSDAIRAVGYATMMKTRYGVNVVASNNSWGGGGYSSALQSAIDAGGDADILFVAAAGNNGTNNDASAFYPANIALPEVISVAATDRYDNLASFSNYGATTVDLGAPGVSIWSLYPGNSLASWSGTSMAAPHVTGAIALLASVFPQATAQQLKAAILAGVDPLTSLSGKTVTGGRLNLVGAMSALEQQLAPTVELLGPAEGSILAVGSNVTLTAQVTGSVQAVEFFANNTLIGVDSAGSTFSIAWQPAWTGDVQLTARAVTTGSAAMSNTLQVSTRVAGDANCDNMVSGADLATVATNWGAQSADWYIGDFNGDGVVDFADLAGLAANWTGSRTVQDALGIAAAPAMTTPSATTAGASAAYTGDPKVMPFASARHFTSDTAAVIEDTIAPSAAASGVGVGQIAAPSTGPVAQPGQQRDEHAPDAAHGPVGQPMVDLPAVSMAAYHADVLAEAKAMQLRADNRPGNSPHGNGSRNRPAGIMPVSLELDPLLVAL